MHGPAERAALSRVPEEAAWVDTRGMLLTGRAVVSFLEPADHEHDGFVVELPSRALLSVVGQPSPELIASRAHALAGDVNVLCTLGAATTAAAALPGWVTHGVRLHALPGVMPWESQPEVDVRVFTWSDAPSLRHLPDTLAAEIQDALDGYPSARYVPGVLPPFASEDRSPHSVPVAAAWADGQPVAFCYPVLQTERWWDVSVDTLPDYRGRGLAGRAARTMIRYMRGKRKAPVWGALETNAASLSVARQLGFAEVGRLVVVTLR
jgi:RimJ/RimL family protein N-acetyltransferase